MNNEFKIKENQADPCPSAPLGALPDLSTFVIVLLWRLEKGVEDFEESQTIIHSID